MADVKTTISLGETLFKEAEALARDMRVSRSRLFAMAVERFLQQYRNQQLLEQLNRAYGDVPDPAEREYRSI